MRLYALISGNNEVSGIVQVENDTQLGALTSIYAQVIDVTDIQPVPQIGWSFDGQSVVGTSQSKKITRLAMRQRFTTSELIGILSSTNPVVQIMLQNLALATFIDLSRSDTQAGVAYLVSQGLLTQERADVILTTPPGILEVYTA